MQSHNTVAVITSTIGRPQLERAILSVQNQTYPCKHYIFVDGEQFHQQAAEILNKFENLVVTYLPMNTGANGWTNSSINAIAPFLVKEEIVCFLDDDNWFEPNHVETGVKALVENQAHYAYALRNFYDSEGNFLCIDAMESIGEYSRGFEGTIYYPLSFKGKEHKIGSKVNTNHHIDTNCYFMTTETARLLSNAWYVGIYNDRNVYEKIKKYGAKGVCTKTISVNYVLEPEKYADGLIKFLMNEPFYFNKEEAEQIAKDSIKFISDKSVEGWGGKLIWEI